MTLEAATTATGGVLEASVLDVDGATVAPATLDVEIVPRAFTLAFDASTVSVIAGATTQVTLTLTGDRALAASDRFAVDVFVCSVRPGWRCRGCGVGAGDVHRRQHRSCGDAGSGDDRGGWRTDGVGA